MNIIYAGILLNAASRSILLSEMKQYYNCEKLPISFCDHITLAYGQFVTPRHKSLVGNKIMFFVNEAVIGPDCACVTVTGDFVRLGCVNKYPHITVACAEGHKPVESNTLLELYNSKKNKFQIIKVSCGFYLEGTCGLFVRYDNGDAKWVVGPE